MSRISAVLSTRIFLKEGLMVYDLEEMIGNVLITYRWGEFVSGGVADIDSVVARFGCDEPETSRMIAAAEILTVRLLSMGVGMEDAAKYERPPILAGLPEETQQLYDEYYLCKVRTGQTDHLGSFGPCDEALFQFELSEAKATGGPVPTRELAYSWQSAKGPIAQYKVRTYGTDFIFNEAPADFTPEMPDRQKYKPPFLITLKFNEGKRGRLWKIKLLGLGWEGVYGRGVPNYRGAARTEIIQDIMRIQKAGNDTLLECRYYGDGRTVEQVIYWHKARPEAAAPERLKSRMLSHPVLLVMDAIDECPPAFTAETRRKRDKLLENPSATRPDIGDDCWYLDPDYYECIQRRITEDREAQRKAQESKESQPAREMPANYAEGEYELLQEVAPVYPRRALSSGIEGYVDLTYTITTTGTVTNPVVVFSTTSLFDRGATKAVLKYRYKPRVVDGRPVEVTGVKTRIVFELDE